MDDGKSCEGVYITNAYTIEYIEDYNTVLANPITLCTIY